MRKKELEKQLLEGGYMILALQKERDSLQRQLQRIRIAHEPLHEAIFPPTIRARG